MEGLRSHTSIKKMSLHNKNCTIRRLVAGALVWLESFENRWGHKLLFAL